MVERPEPQVVGGDLGSAVGVPRVVVDGVLQRGDVRRLAGLVVKVTGHLLGELLDPPDGLTQRPEGRREHLADRAVVAERRLLPEQHQVARPPGRLDGAGDPRRGRKAAGHGAQQRGLAGPVLAHQADAPARLGDEVDAGEGRGVAEGDGQVADDDGVECRHAES